MGENTQKSSFLWLFIEKVFRTFNALVIGLWVARALGPEDFGQFSVALGVVLMLTPLASWGLDVLLVRHLVSKAHAPMSLLGSGFLIRLFSGGVLWCLMSVGSYFWFGELKLFWWVIGAMLPLGAFRVYDFFLQSESCHRWRAWLGIVSVLFSALLKIIFILFDCGLEALALAYVAEWLSLMVLHTIYYTRVYASPLEWKWNGAIGKKLGKEGFFLMLSGVVVVLYMKVDLLMVDRSLGGVATGIYAASSRLLEGLYFLPQILLMVFFPELVRSWEKGPEDFESRLVGVFRWGMFISLSLIICGQMALDMFVETVLGKSYDGVLAVLRVHLLCFLPVSLSMIWGYVLMVKEAHGEQFIRNLLGALLNILLNLLLIPKFGLIGAAWASFVSFVFLGVIFPLLSPGNRSLGLSMVRVVWPCRPDVKE